MSGAKILWPNRLCPNFLILRRLHRGGGSNPPPLPLRSRQEPRCRGRQNPCDSSGYVLTSPQSPQSNSHQHLTEPLFRPQTATQSATRLLPEMSPELAEILATWSIAFDQPEFLEKGASRVAVRGRDRQASEVRLLRRYVPDSPRGDSADAWDTWWKENRAYLFASDAGDYRWYIDPLAKKRGVPSSELRGPRLANRL